MSKFYVVATPIGNLGDITLRALETLKNVDLILCEDTRQTKKLLDKYEIKKPTMSYHSQSKLSKTDKIFELLREGKDLALVSDAGTPTISDPGAMLISEIKAKFSGAKSLDPSGFRENFGDEAKSSEAGSPDASKEAFRVDVIPIPGVSAVITALSSAGFPTHEFTFLGFLPHKKGRETLFKEIALSERTMVFYESPHRILKTLESLNKFCPQKRICIARELTKIYEEFKTGSALDLLAYLTENSTKQRGEFTVLVEGK